MQKFKYQWFSVGDIGAAATIIFDILTVLLFVSLILQFGFHFPLDIILKNIVPGAVVGVLVGNIMCIGLAFITARKYGDHVTAIPHGLDAPSAIGFASCIVGPAFLIFKHSGLDPHTAAIQAWHIGICCLFMTGVMKLCSSLIITRLSSYFPSPALLGAIGGLALAIIGFLPLIAIFKVPAIGIPTLAVILLGIYAKCKLPFNFPTIPGAIIMGTVIYYVLLSTGLAGELPNVSSHAAFAFMLTPDLSAANSFGAALIYFPVFFPFALLVIFGTISVVESVDSYGKEQYNVKHLIVIDGISTIVSSLFGGITQTTPYVGFPAYKKMDARSGFLIINIIVVGIGGLFGLFGLFVDLIPESVIAPVLLFVAFEISIQGLMQSKAKYTVAILFAFLPSLARLLEIKIPDGNFITVEMFQQFYINQLPHITDQFIIILLGNGFFITAVLWGSWMCYIIDNKRKPAFLCALALSILSFFGVIHSVYLNGQAYIASSLPMVLRNIAFSVSLGYLFCGIITFVLLRPKKDLLES